MGSPAFVLASLSLLFAVTGCGPTGREASLHVERLGPAGAGHEYVAWLETPTEYVAIARFDGGPDQVVLTNIDEEVLEEALAHQGDFVVTVQATDQEAMGPHWVVSSVLTGGRTAGVQYGSEALASPDVYQAVQVSPDATLGTPTTATNDDRVQGLWWVNLNSPFLEAAADDAWVYEGWVITDAGRFSTGRFSADGPDHDGAGPYAGPDAGWAHPGQDFIEGALRLEGARAEITLEPEPDTSPEPFSLVVAGTEHIPDSTIFEGATSDTFDSFPLEIGYDGINLPKVSLEVPLEDS